MKSAILLVIVLIIFALAHICLKTNFNQKITTTLCSRACIKYDDLIKHYPLSSAPRKIYVFFHMCNIGSYKQIIREQMESLITSGLYDIADGLFYSCSCTECVKDLQTLLQPYPKMQRLPIDVNTRHHENDTINYIIEFSKHNPDSNILYIHSKGVSNKSTSQTYWRNIMMYYMVSNWKSCVDLLQRGFLTVGIMYNPCRIIKHYSGNFWWASASYLSQLKPIEKKNR